MNTASVESPASATEIVVLLGDVEPITVARLMAAGATMLEIAEAVRAMEIDEVFDDSWYVPSSRREAKIRSILEENEFERP